MNDLFFRMLGLFVIIAILGGIMALLLHGCSSTMTATHSQSHCITTIHGNIEDTDCTHDSTHATDSKGL